MTNNAHTGQPELTVVVVTYRSEETIERCIGPLLDAPEGFGIEIVVVSNGPDDHALDRQLAPFSGRIEVVRMGWNAGFSRACNLGLARAKGRRVLFLNPDASIDVSDLQQCVAQLDKWPDVGAMTCRLIRETGELDHACKRNIPTPVSAASYFFRRSAETTGGYLAPEVGEFDTGEVEAITGAFMLGPRHAFTSVGGFDETFWMYGEDLDLCVRLREAGWRIVYWPGVTALHVKGASSGRARSWKVNRAFHESMLLFFKKHQREASPLSVRLLVPLAIKVRMIAVYAASIRRSGL